MHACRYRDALDAAIATRKAEVVISVIEELAARSGLDNALGGRDAASLALLLGFLARHIAEPRYGKLACSVTHRVLDLYASVVSKGGSLHSFVGIITRARKALSRV